MKIVYISTSIIPSRTANSIHVMKMCQAFADNGHEVTLLAPDHKDQYEKNITSIYDFYGVRRNFKIIKIPIPKIRVRTLVYTFSILKHLFFNKPELVYGRCLRGCYISSLTGFKTIFESHKLEWGIIKLTKSKNFEKLVVISQALKDRYATDGQINERMIQVVHDGADKVNDFETKAKLKGKKNNLKVGYVGHLYQGKGMEVIEKISDKVSDDIEFHIIGGMKNDIEFWSNTICSKNVYFYGFVSQSKVSSYINSLDICILPNQKIVRGYGAGKNIGSNIGDFTSPLKMFEYMAHKKPIIASDLKVLKEVLNDDIALLVNPENGNQWIDAINKLKDKNLRETISNNAIKEFNNYTWKNRANKVLCLK
ncbi:MAG: glycosyltransferase [Thermodesulfobacteriota bacterium]|nr:glycosyltransferase [Thermodesulfobacteriota bacterium]